MELKNINTLEKATDKSRKELLRIGIALLFVVGVMLYTSMQGMDTPGGFMLIIAAMTIGANSVGIAVGSKALTLTGAITIAAIFEASGALIAGGDVVSTIKEGIIDPALIANSDTFI